MSDAEDLHALGNWIVQNPDKKGSEDWNTVATAFKNLDSKLQATAQRDQDYRGLSGNLKAGAQGAAVGAVGDTLDMLNFINPVNYAVEGIHSAVTGEPFKMNRASSGYERLWGKPEDIAPNARPYYYGGRMAGNALTAGLATGGIADAVAPAVQGVKYLGPAMKALAETPLKREAAAAAGAGTGTYLADMVAPDNAAGHLAGGIAGSVFGPSQLLRYLGGGVQKATGGRVGQAVGDMINPERGATENVYRIYQEGIADAENAMGRQNDPDLIRPLVEKQIQNDMANVGTLPANAPSDFVASEHLQSIAQTLKNRDPRYAYTLEQKGKGALTDLMSEATNIPGDAATLLEAAKARAAGVTGKATQRAETANRYADVARQEAIQAGQDLRVSPEMESAIGPALKEQFQSGLAERKAGLDDLESQIPTDRVLGPTIAQNLRGRHATIVNGSITSPAFPTAELSADTQSLLGYLAKKKDATVEDYMSLYEQLRRDSRNFRANPDKARAATFADELGDAVSHAFDWRKVPGVRERNAAAKEMYDIYGRAPGVTEMLDRTSRGGSRKMPELGVENVLGGSDVAQTQKIENALRAAQNPDQARTLLETGQRAQVGKSVLDPETGLPKSNAISNALQKEPGVYKQFPGLTDDMLSARQAAVQAEDMGAAAERRGVFSRQLEESLAPNPTGKGVTSRVLGNAEDPIRVVEGAVKSANPLQELDKVYRLANRSQGEEGLKGMLRDYLSASGDPFEAAAKAFNPLSQGSKTTLADWMKARNLLSKQEYDVMRNNFGVVLEAQRAKGLGVPAADLEAKMPDVLDVGARMVGASAGSAASGLIGRRTLIGAQVGSEQLRKLLDRITPRQRKLLEQKMLHPKEMEAFLGNVLNAGQRVNPAPAPKGPLPFALHPAAQAAVGHRYSQETRKKPRGLLN